MLGWEVGVDKTTVSRETQTTRYLIPETIAGLDRARQGGKRRLEWARGAVYVPWNWDLVPHSPAGPGGLI